MSAQEESNVASLHALSKTAGVDFNGLRDKYLNIKGKAIAEAKGQPGAQPEAKNLERLDNYRICKWCNGRGTVKSVYNHMVLERDCEECDGESIVLSNQRLEEIAKGLA